MGNVVTRFSFAMLVAAGSIVILSKQAASIVNAVDLANSSGVVVTDRSGYFIVTMGQVEMILAANPG